MNTGRLKKFTAYFDALGSIVTFVKILAFTYLPIPPSLVVTLIWEKSLLVGKLVYKPWFCTLQKVPLCARDFRYLLVTSDFKQ